MPKVALTASQREANKKADRAKRLADGLLIHKALCRLTFEQMAAKFGVDKRSIKKLVNGQDCYIPMSVALEMVEVIGGIKQ